MIAATRRLVAGAMALASTYVPANGPSPRATGSAAGGGHTDTTTPLIRASPATVTTSARPDASARRAVAALRPADAHRTSRPAARRAAPIPAPMSPGWSRPMGPSSDNSVTPLPYGRVTFPDGNQNHAAHHEEG